MEENNYKCRHCGYIIPENLYFNVICDVGCPRCNASLTTFKRQPAITTTAFDVFKGIPTGIKLRRRRIK